MTINPDILRLTNIGDNPCLWGIKFVYCNMGIQPKKTSIKDTLIQERKGEHIRNKNRKERENREITEIIGISIEEYREFDKDIKGDFSKRYNRTAGRVRTLNRAINQHKEKIRFRQEKIDAHLEELKRIKGGFTPYLKLLNPNVQLKKPRDNFPYWKGRIWFNMGYNPKVYGFNVKGRNIDIHICSDKERKKMNYSDEDMKEICVRKFRQKLIKSDFGIISEYQR